MKWFFANYIFIAFSSKHFWSWVLVAVVDHLEILSFRCTLDEIMRLVSLWVYQVGYHGCIFWSLSYMILLDDCLSNLSLSKVSSNIWWQKAGSAQGRARWQMQHCGQELCHCTGRSWDHLAHGQDHPKKSSTFMLVLSYPVIQVNWTASHLL